MFRSKWGLFVVSLPELAVLSRMWRPSLGATELTGNPWVNAILRPRSVTTVGPVSANLVLLPRSLYGITPSFARASATGRTGSSEVQEGSELVDDVMAEAGLVGARWSSEHTATVVTRRTKRRRESDEFAAEKPRLRTKALEKWILISD